MNASELAEELVRFEMSGTIQADTLIVVLGRRHHDTGGFVIRCGRGSYDEPTWSDTDVSDDTAASIMAAFDALRLPLIPPFVLGCDGTNYRLIIDRGFNRVEFTWWSVPPTQWAPLFPVVQRLIDCAGPSADGVQIID
jgi:hypothetical protein